METAPSKPADLTDAIPGLSFGQEEELKRLGPLQEIYTSDSSSRRRNMRMLWAGIAVGLLGLAPVLVVMGTGEFKKNRAGLIGGLCLAGLFLPACSWRLFQVARGARVRILVFTEGLARFDEENATSVNVYRCTPAAPSATARS